MRSLGRPALDTAPSAAPDAADPYRAWKQAGLLLLAVAWIALGLTGHDPWKFDDATTFGVAWEMAQRHDYVVPHLAGEVYLRNPPLVPATFERRGEPDIDDAERFGFSDKPFAD